MTFSYQNATQCKDSIFTTLNITKCFFSIILILKIYEHLQFGLTYDVIYFLFNLEGYKLLAKMNYEASEVFYIGAGP